MKQNNWYQNSYRRSLVDMHISDWDERFLLDFNPETYYQCLKKAGIQTAELYLQSHVGLCYYPTRSGKIHRAFLGREDRMRQLEQLCHAGGMSVVGYYSLIFNTYEEDHHPEWRLIDGENGTSARQRGSRYGHCCPNNQEYRAFVEAQIAEIAEYFHLDGIFYDMTYWPGICRCDSCRKRFRDETGMESLPDMSDLNQPAADLFRRKRYEWIGEFADWVTALTRRLMPGVSVSHNYAYGVSGDWTEASSEAIARATDYCGGDLYSNIFAHSFCMKYYYANSPALPFEYMTSRFETNLKQHTVSKSEEMLTQDILLTAAHHGATLLIDAIDPVGTLDDRVYERAAKAFSSEEKYEPYFSGKMMGDIGIWYLSKGRFNLEGQNFQTLTCSVALAETLRENHILYGVVGKRNPPDSYRVLMIPAAAGMTEEERETVISYVKNGGNLYFSGAQEPELLLQLFGGKVDGYTAEKYTYAAPVVESAAWEGFSAKYPLAFAWKQPLVSIPEGCVTVLSRVALPYSFDQPGQFASIHSNPPGRVTEYPSLVRGTLGKGHFLWSAVPLEAVESSAHRKITINFIRELFTEKEQCLTTDAPRQVEAIAFSDTGRILVSFVDLAYTDEKKPVGSFRVSIRVGETPERVCLLPEQTEIPFSVSDGQVHFTVESLNLFAMYEISFPSRRNGKK